MVLHFRKATGIFIGTLPWVLVRFAVGLAFTALAVAYFAAIAFLLFTLAGISGGIALVGLLVAGIVFYGFFRLLRRYVLYLVTAGHVAVIAHAVDTGEIPPNQIRFGKDRVRGRFTEASVLFGVDMVVQGVIKQFNGTVTSVGRTFGFVPGLKQLMTVVRRTIGIAASYIDQAILAHMFLNDSKGNWTAARDGVVLYGKTWKPVLATTLLIVLGTYVALLGLLLLLTPLAGVLGGLAPALEVGGWIVVGALVLVSYVGFFDPWVKTVVITTYLLEAADETPDNEMMDTIAARSSEFRGLVEKAESETPPVDVSSPSTNGDLYGRKPI
ncbi:hypothetical protein JCM18237_27580 [Halorubrum luteum]